MLRPSFKQIFNDDNFGDGIDIDPGLETDHPSVTENVDSQTSRKEVKGRSAGKKDDPNWDSDRSVYEMQLNQLQEQLVETMLENQQLATELQKFKEKGLDTLTKDLEEERKKTKKLEEKLRKIRPRRPPEPSVKDKKSPDKREKGEHAEGWEDLTEVADSTVYPEGILIASGISSVNNLAFAGSLRTKNERTMDKQLSDKSNLENIAEDEPSRIVQWKIKAWNFLHDRVSDFVDDENEEKEIEEEDDSLAIKTLRENVSRFSDGIQPIRQFISKFEQMVNWKNPWFSLSAFVIYLYSVWIGCFVPLVLLIAIIKLTTNYLYAKGFAQRFGYSEKKKETEEDVKGEVTSWSERYQLILQIARKVQNTLGSLASSIEKFESLFTWQHHDASRQLYTMLIVAFFSSLVLPTRYFFLPIGFGLGFKFFVVSPIYKKFPKVKKRYDNVARVWEELPIHEDISNRKAKTETDIGGRKISVQATSATPEDGLARPGSRERDKREATIDEDTVLNWDAIVFCDRFALPQAEVPLAGWHDGRRCTLLNKDSPLSNMKHGRLYLTNNFICFERNQFHSKKNFALRLHDVIEVQKSKPFSFFPGGGMSIEVTTKTNEKPFLFGAMMGRDEAYESILRAARALNLGWGRKS